MFVNKITLEGSSVSRENLAESSFSLDLLSDLTKMKE